MTADSQSTMAERRHTIAARPKPRAPKAAAEGVDLQEAVYSPPDTLKESLYATVNKKNKRYPAPSVPAPPPPYEKKNASKEETDASTEETSEATSPPGYEPVSAGSGPMSTKPPGNASGPPPSRPSRPPAGI